MTELTLSKAKRGRPFKGGSDPRLDTRVPKPILAAVKNEAERRGSTPAAIARDAVAIYLRNLGYELGTRAA